MVAVLGKKVVASAISISVGATFVSFCLAANAWKSYILLATL